MCPLRWLLQPGSHVPGLPCCPHPTTCPAPLAPPNSSLDESQEATWRASGQHLKLQWLSPPATVLVVYKPVPSVFPACVRAVAWLLQRGVTVYVEPEVHAELTAAVAAHQEGILSGSAGAAAGGAGSTLRRGEGSAAAFGSSPGSGAVGGASEDGGTPGGSAEIVGSPFASFHSRDSFDGASGMHAALGGRAPTAGLPPRSPPAAVDLSRQLRTWQEPDCGCPPAVPSAISHLLDLVITLGGDGTVLWTCGLFAAGPVPPLVPFAMGSLVRAPAFVSCALLCVQGDGCGYRRCGRQPHLLLASLLNPQHHPGCLPSRPPPDLQS